MKRIVLLTLALWFTLYEGRSIVFLETDNPLHNTGAPTGDLAASGWRLQGRWGSYLGTPVSPKYFITASHVPGKIGDEFELEGVSYPTTAVYRSPSSDLSLWRICGEFANFAALYAATNEPGERVVAFGRGAERGLLVTSEGLAGPQTNGWQWGSTRFVRRWGENVVTEIVDGNEWMAGEGIGDLLRIEFNAPGIPNECHLSSGDSGGGVFLRDGDAWKLAGINYAVDGPYRPTGEGREFEAALFDQGGLYAKDGTNWVYLPDTLEDQPGAFYATRIASNLEWIRGILDQPIPDEERTVLQSAVAVHAGYLDDPQAQVDELSRTISLPRPPEPRFYRLRSCRPRRITSVQLEGETLELTYE